MALTAFATIMKPQTNEVAKAEFYITEFGGRPIVHTNYAPIANITRPSPDDTWSPSFEFGPTIEDAIAAVTGLQGHKTAFGLGTVFSGSEGITHDEITVSDFLRKATFIVQRSALGEDGRPPIDLSGATKIRISDDDGLIQTGPIEVMVGGKPPPKLIERLKGCCFNGQPPGRGKDILARLRAHKFSPANTKVASFVVDSGTTNFLSRSPVLKRLNVGAQGGTPWRARLDNALSESSGGNLVLLTHVLGSKVVVEDATGKTIYSIELAELQALAVAKRVKLVLLGCETAGQAEHADLSLGVLGRYNTRAAAERIEVALRDGRDGDSFLSTLSAKGIKIVVQPGSWSSTGVGATVFARSREQFGGWVKVLRVWFMGVGHGS
ncbi:hypothetical protein [Sphingomonas mollis]|uniref:CHAT domain-containing protein n=1 Tax=Sphingomonas mollis TaxID=2795726 RepID=A0ABS0XUC5_9SPHN|nr:hypothetical protein [Sphingomonas sp. BT553]MBJ6123634.1 hypothetical protein [Sphingomonas sp. BT553]